MPKIAYKQINFRDKSLELIDKVNEIVGEYDAQNYELTLRQLYYQLVARDIIPNNQRSYENIGALVNNGRLCRFNRLVQHKRPHAQLKTARTLGQPQRDYFGGSTSVSN